MYTMIIKTDKKGGVTIYYLEKDIDDVKMDSMKNKFLKKEQIKTIIDHDADVYGANGILLLRFRKNVLQKEHIDAFYDNVIKFAKNKTANRGSATGSKKKNIYDNPKIMTNIFGYFDRWSVRQKYIFKQREMKIPLAVRECRFNMDYPEEYKQTLPMIKDVDELYKKLTPDHYAKQRKKADQTHFKIPGTAFTTITTNVNFQTTIHKDSGDDSEGFGNLLAIERGEYDGGETCFPQYGVGVDVRTGDALFMNVHEWHANLPIKLKTPESIRLSIVCYLRYNIWDRTKNKTRKFFDRHNQTVRRSRTEKKM
jgi:hypothetical protein